MISFGDKELDGLAEKVIPSEFFEFEPELLRDLVFNTDRMLAVKQRIFETHRVSGVPLAAHLQSCLDLKGVESVLDLGCGNGVQIEMIAPMLKTGRIVGLDLAPGVLEAADKRLKDRGFKYQLMESSADDLSALESASFDRIMANYMLHYVPDIESCLSEVRRVLRPGGKFIVTTNSTKSMVEMYDVHFKSLKLIGAPGNLFKASPKGKISLENGGDLLRRYFDRVDLRRRPDVLEFTTVEPFLEFYAVGHNFCSAASRPDVDLDQEFFDRLLNEVRDQVRTVIAQSGRYTVTKLTGSFVCE